MIMSVVQICDRDSKGSLVGEERLPFKVCVTVRIEGREVISATETGNNIENIQGEVPGGSGETVASSSYNGNYLIKSVTIHKNLILS